MADKASRRERVEVLADAAGTEVEQVIGGNAAGYWFSGEPHVLTPAGADGRFFTDRARLASNTLLWQRGSVPYRLESALSRDEAIRITGSLLTQH